MQARGSRVRVRSLAAVVVACVIVLSLLSGIVAYAVDGTDGGMHYAAVNRSDGSMRLLSGAEARVKTNEYLIWWNQLGPVGPQGSVGPTGAAGPPGPQGEPGMAPEAIASLEGRVMELELANSGLRNQIDALAARLDALEAVQTQARLAALEDTASALDARLAGLEQGSGSGSELGDFIKVLPPEEENGTPRIVFMNSWVYFQNFDGTRAPMMPAQSLPPQAPQGFKLWGGTATDGRRYVYFSWGTVTNASEYRVYRRPLGTSSWTRIAEGTETYCYDWTAGEASYEYAVAAFNTSTGEGLKSVPYKFQLLPEGATIRINPPSVTLWRPVYTSGVSWGGSATVVDAEGATIDFDGVAMALFSGGAVQHSNAVFVDGRASLSAWTNEFLMSAGTYTYSPRWNIGYTDFALPAAVIVQ